MSDKPFDQEISDHDIEDFNKNIMAKIKEYNELNELAMHKMQLSRYQKYADTCHGHLDSVIQCEVFHCLYLLSILPIA